MPLVDVAYDLSHAVRGAEAAPGAPPLAVLSLRGVLRAATATLIVAAPGAGASTLLRLLASRSAPQAGSRVLFNGRSARELERAGVSAARLCGLVAQGDEHEATLTVRETLDFAADIAAVPEEEAAAGAGTGAGTEAERGRHAANGAGGAGAAPSAAEAVMEALGLSAAADTVVGSAALRGISGGQARRLSVGEALLAQPRVLALDGATTGLDGETARRILLRLTGEARAGGGVLIAALHQPGPELVALFDDVLLLAEGQELYHGPRQRLTGYLAEAGLAVPRLYEVGEWLAEIVADPRRAARIAAAGVGAGGAEGVDSGPRADEDAPDVNVASLAQRWRESADFAATLAAMTPLLDDARLRDAAERGVGSGGGGGGSAADHSCAAGLGALALLARRAMRRLLMLEAESASSQQQQQLAPVPPPQPEQQEPSPPPLSARGAAAGGSGAGSIASGGVILASRHARLRYGLRAPAPPLRQLQLLVQRQARLVLHNTPLLFARIAAPAVMAAILGTVLLAKPPDPFVVLYGVSFFACTFFGMSNNAEVTTILKARSVVYKHLGARLYSPGLWIAAVVLVSLPLALASNLAFSGIAYWTTGFTPDVSRFLFFVVVLAGVDLWFAAYLRLLALAVPSQDVANAVGAGVLGIWLLTAGFYVVRNEMPVWLAWLAWTSPFWYALSALANNEFSAPRWGAEGAVFLAAFDVPFSRTLQWLAVAFLLGGALLFTLLVPALFTEAARFDAEPGTRRELQAPRPRPQPQPQLQARRDAHELMLLLPFTESALVFADVSYTVPAPSAPPHALAHAEARTPLQALARAQAPELVRVHAALAPAPGAAAARAGPRELQLLAGVSGCALPGRLVALMGATGAGKSTCLDVLAGRKTHGHVSGAIRLFATGGAVAGGLGGVSPAGLPAPAPVVCYAEQVDLHAPRATVGEALLFSSRLRCAGVSEERRGRAVEALLDLLELAPLRARAVCSLARGELKRVTIAVELAANPAVLFLDEPTTGLDARAAAVLVRVLRRVAATGRTVVCTIHQPSAEVFLHFDDLLLLTAGRTAYFGPVGFQGAAVLPHFEALAGRSLPPLTNPITFVQAVLHDVSAADAADAFARSEQAARNAAQVRALLSQADAAAGAAGAPSAAAAAVAAARRPVPKPRPSRSFGAQFALALERAFLDLARNRNMQLSRLAVVVFQGLLLGLLFLRVEFSSFAGTQSGLGLCIGAAAFGSIVYLQTTLGTHLAMRPVFYREHAAKYYVSTAHALALLVAGAPHLLATSALFASIVYWLTPLRPFAASWAFFYLSLTVSAAFFAATAAAFAALLPTPQVAQVVVGASISVLVLFAGLFITPQRIPPGWIGLYYADPLSHILRALAANEFFCAGQGCPRIAVPGGGEQSQWHYLQHYLGIGATYHSRFQFGELGYACAAVAVMSALTVVFYEVVRHERR
jgi:ABC-type multidrug transport system ATPase subunit/ABC-type multidrug transport system permease subunit